MKPDLCSYNALISAAVSWHERFHGWLIVGTSPIGSGCETPSKWPKWVFPKIGVPQNGWFIMGNPIKMDDLRVPLFLETSKWTIYRGYQPLTNWDNPPMAAKFRFVDHDGTDPDGSFEGEKPP